ncbi:haloacid dehalogenase-like hydrolase domain-containing protein 2 [Anas acuta]|uniref:haloacid dehalogenase-like hydrolase domain-containing protein 2 n=1 Tax=Anas acuta TaxID=28680 RepID=UPI0035C8E296
MRLCSAPVMIWFVTNTMKECKRDLLERLTKLGFDIAENEIFTSLTAIRNLLEQKQVQPLLLVDKKALPDFTGEVHGEQHGRRCVAKGFDLVWLISDVQGREHYEPFVNKLCPCPQTNSSPILSQDCRDDDSGAQNTGMCGILVRTGKYQPGDEDKINPAPYLTCESFPEIVEHILDHMLWEME